MLSPPRYSRLLALLAATSLATSPAIQAAAQTPAPGPAPAAQNSGGDPPAVVGRLAGITGTVSYHGPEDTEWQAATLNYPVQTGDSFWTEPQAHAAIEATATRIEMMSATELDLSELDQQTLSASEPQGEICLWVRALPGGSTISIQTPRSAVQIGAPGHYAVVSGDTQNPTTVNVLDGAAQVTGTNLALQVGPHQMASVSGTDTFQGSVGPGPQDPCLSAMLAEEHPAAAPAATQAVAPPPEVQYMTGYDDLDQYGAWQSVPDYGQVWYPQVASSWVPYREGRWAYVAPWGWTWVDNEPWGFAPFHYGRWAYIHERWGWVPTAPGVPVARPVYAPALVSFFGVGAAAAVGAAAGFALGAAFSSGSVGWVPLGPREPYYPWYHASPAYVRQINVTHVTNITQVVNNYNNRAFIDHPPEFQRFANARVAATVVPATVMMASRPVAAAHIQLNQRQFAQVRPVVARMPIAPTTATIGVDPRVARQLHVPAPPHGIEVAARPAPGPAVRPEELHGRPMLRPVANAVPGAVRPGEARPGETRPGEASPGETRPGEARPGEPNAAMPRPGMPVAARPGEAPGLRAPGTRPAIPGERVAPEARPGMPVAARPGEAPELRAPGAHPATPGQLAAPGLHPVAPAHPGAAPELRGPEGHPGEPAASRPGLAPAAARPLPEAAHPPAPAHPAEQRPAEQRPAGIPHPVAARPAEMPHAAPRPPEMPHPVAARPAEVPHEAPHPAASRPEPRPAPRPEAPRPEAHPAAASHPAPQHPQGRPEDKRQQP
jgi:hypothetical protein